MNEKEEKRRWLSSGLYNPEDSQLRTNRRENLKSYNEKVEVVALRDTIFNGGNKFSAMKVPRQYPLVLLVKVG
jgi:hypothetical protein